MDLIQQQLLLKLIEYWSRSNSISDISKLRVSTIESDDAFAKLISGWSFADTKHLLMKLKEESGERGESVFDRVMKKINRKGEGEF